MPLPDANKKSPRVYTNLQNIDLDSVTFANVQSTGNPIAVEAMNEDEMRRLVLVNLARLVCAGEWNGLLTAGGGAETLGELTDVLLDATNFTDGLLIQTNSDGSAPSTGTLSGAENNLGIGKNVFSALAGGTNNVAYGNDALEDITSGSYSVGIGHRALKDVTTQSQNTAVGAYAGQGIGNGSDNVAIGANVLRTANASTQNTGVGTSALNKNSGGNSNTAVGYVALYNVTSAHSNCGFGKGAGYVVTGALNICIGFEAGYTLSSGSNNVIIGGVEPDSVTADDQLVVSAGDGGFFWIKGDSAGACYQGDNATAWSQTSDRSLKREITNATKGLDAINEIQVRNFRYRKDNEYGLDPEPSRVGVIAQELEEVFPEAVKQNLNGHKTVSPDSINWALLRAVQELSAKVEALESAA